MYAYMIFVIQSCDEYVLGCATKDDVKFCLCNTHGSGIVGSVMEVNGYNLEKSCIVSFESYLFT